MQLSLSDFSTSSKFLWLVLRVWMSVWLSATMHVWLQYGTIKYGPIKHRKFQWDPAKCSRIQSNRLHEAVDAYPVDSDGISVQNVISRGEGTDESAEFHFRRFRPRFGIGTSRIHCETSPWSFTGDVHVDPDPNFDHSLSSPSVDMIHVLMNVIPTQIKSDEESEGYFMPQKNTRQQLRVLQ